MSYKIDLSRNFKKEAKKLIKKYSSLKAELAGLFAELEDNPTKGIPLGNDVYKIRLVVASKVKGKSGGASNSTSIPLAISYTKLFSTPPLMRLKTCQVRVHIPERATEADGDHAGFIVKLAVLFIADDAAQFNP